MTSGEMNGLNWYWIGLEASVVPILGVLFALPLWLKEQPVFGNIAGTVVIFGSAFALIMREHMQIEAMVGTCLEGGIPCFRIPTPSCASPSMRSWRCSK